MPYLKIFIEIPLEKEIESIDLKKKLGLSFCFSIFIKMDKHVNVNISGNRKIIG
jgi:hypothetical protein